MSTTASTSSSSTSNFPTAAIAVVAIVAGLIAIVIAYKLYVWYHNRKNQDKAIPYPEKRPNPITMNGAASPGMMSMAFGGDRDGRMSPMQGGRGSLANARRMNSSMGFSDASWGGSSYALANEKEYSPPGSASGGHTPPGGLPNSRSGSPYVSSNNGSRVSLAERSAGNRASLTPSGGYGGRYSGGMRSMGSSNRLSGAPHAPHSRIDIVPPLPLAPPPGTVIATDKSTLDFSPLSGIGTATRAEEWFAANPNATAADYATHGRERTMSGGGGYARPNPNFDGEGSGFDRRSSSGSGMASGSGHSFPPTPRGRDTRGGGMPPAGSRSGSPRISGSTSAEWEAAARAGPSRLSQQAQGVPPIDTGVSGSGPGFTTSPTSPLEKLQQQIAAQAASREEKARARSERVRRANEELGSEGNPFSSGSGSGSGSASASRSGGSASGSEGQGRSGGEVGGYVAPRERLEEIISSR
ncbi:hypothetical protein MNV49_002745 [Pseudohyphozyma bogoriensis]|nr:hypothetical protein MNV49_002745 [Pseudohyphozyma bogoriensis]